MLSTMLLQYRRLTSASPARRQAPWAPNRTAILCLLMACIALLMATAQVQADASASALREGNIVSPGKAARDTRAFGPVEDLSGAVFADEVPARDATGQVELVGSVGVMPKVPRAEVGGEADGEGRDPYATIELNKSTDAESDGSTRGNPLLWITLSSSAALGLLSLYTIYTHRQPRDSHSQITTTTGAVPTMGISSILGAGTARSRSPTKGTRLDSGFISGQSALLGDHVNGGKEDKLAESEDEGKRVGTSSATVLVQGELQALDLN